jgi:predicted nucleotidyltransferase
MPENKPKIPPKLISALLNLANEIPLEGLVLFGSQAQGALHSESDIDILAIANVFANLTPFERLAKVFSVWSGKKTLEAVCISPNELSNSLFSPLFWEIFEVGIVIKSFPQLNGIINTFQKLKSKGFLDKDEGTWKFSRSDLDNMLISDENLKN